MNVPPLEFQEKSHPELQPGGRYRPKECKARHKVAIVIPFRDRAAHLAVFLHNIHPFLQKQQIDYAIYIVEQAGKYWNLKTEIPNQLLVVFEVL